MRSIIALALVLLASTVSAGSIRPAACTTTSDEDNAFKTLVRNSNQNVCKGLGLPKTCSDAEAKAVDPTATIYPTTAAGFQDYTTPIYCGMVKNMAADEQKRRAAQDIAARWLLASPALQDSIDASLPPLP